MQLHPLVKLTTVSGDIFRFFYDKDKENQNNNS